jgi:hypothetical protein
MNVNQEEMRQIYNRFTLNDGEKAQAAGLRDRRLKVIVLTEDWCGDAMLNNPVLLRITEAANIDVRFLLRDHNLELMDQYLTNGTSRSIPIFIFIDEKGQEKAVWGPRAQIIQELVNDERSKLPAQENPDFKEKQMEMYKQLRARYLETKEIWHIVAESILSALNCAK